MKVLIIEDETPAAEWIISLLKKLAPDIQILGVLQEVKTAVQWFSTNPKADLVFMDISLSDGLSLEIFEKADPACPVVFTTAYDQYWQEAFKLHSIDYLLKPITLERLAVCYNKYLKLREHFQHDSIFRLLENKAERYKSRFIIRKATELMVLETSQIAYLYSRDKICFFITDDGKKHMATDNLVELENQLNPADFFRLNRNVIASRNAIQKISMMQKSKLAIQLRPDFSDEIIISSERSAEFKAWLEK